MCSRNGKACTKNPSIKNNCPFIMYFIRKSALIDRETHRVNDNFNIAVNPRTGIKTNKRVMAEPILTKDEDPDDDDDDDLDEEDEEKKYQ
jgi:hypothetical protein